MDWTFNADASGIVTPADEARAALGRLRGALADTAPAKAYEAAAASVGRSAGAISAAAKRAASAVASSASTTLAPVGRMASYARRSVTQVTDAVKDTKAFGIFRDAATVTGFAAGKAFGSLRSGAGAVLGGLTGGAKALGGGLGSVANAGRAAGGKLREAFSGAGDSFGRFLGPLKSAGPLLLAGLGAAGLAGLGKLALGARGMAQLQVITARAQLGFKRLFAGVDSAPLLRAAERLSRNFTDQTVTGRALGGILTRAFNGIFAAVEAAEPYVTAFGQGMILAFLYAEQAVLKARLALAPYTGALGGLVSSTTLMRVAAVLGGGALVAMAGYAVVAAAPFLALAAAILAVSAAFEQASKLAKEWDENSSSQIWRKFKDDVGLGGSQQDKDRSQGILLGDDYDKAQAAKGAAVGKAMGDGMVAGMAASEAAVAAAGGKLAMAAEQGAKDAAEIKSPARRFRREIGRQIGEGVALGEEDMKGRVQRAAASSLVPDPAGLPALGGGGGGGGGIVGPLISIAQLIVQGGEGMRDEVLDAVENAAQHAAEVLGLTVPSRS